MKKLFNSILTSFVIILTVHTATAQLQGISYTLSPYAEYHWFNNTSGLENGLIGGLQLGLGFGEYVELGANYAQGIGLNTLLNQFDFDPTASQNAAYTKRDVEFKRYGGELKLNLSRGALLPYFTIGAGVQSIGADSLTSSDQLYVVPGLGIKFSAGDRYTIGFQAMNYNYNFNANQSLLSSAERLAYGLPATNTSQENLSNWALRASLAFYLGGRKPGELSDIDKAYLDQFSSGFQGLSIPIELHYSKMDFHSDLPYSDAWMAGVSTGLNFGPLVGLRGFYSRAIDDSGSGFELDDLAMYGGEVKFKLNEGKGIIPWITLGGGNIYTGSEYSGITDAINIDKNKGFVMAGLGLEIPFSKYVKLTGYTKSVLTTNQEFENLSMPDEVISSWNYGLSLNFVMGKKKEKIEVVKQSAFDEYLLTSSIEQEIAKEKLIQEYEEKLSVLEEQLAEAVANKDLEAVKEISDRKEETEKVIEELDKKSVEKVVEVVEIEKVEAPVTAAPVETVPAPTTAPVPPIAAPVQPTMNSTQGSIQMTPEELRLLIKEILKGLKQSEESSHRMDNSHRSDMKGQRDARMEELGSMQRKINELEGQIEYPARSKQMREEVIYQGSDSTVMVKSEGQIYEQMERLENKINQLIQQNVEWTNQMDAHSKENSNMDNQLSEYNEDQLQEIIDITNQRMDDMEYMLERYLKEMDKPKKNKSSKNITIIDQDFIETEVDTNSRQPMNEWVRYTGMSGFAGFGIGNNTTFNLGYRVHFDIGNENTPFEFMPESFFGLGSPSSFGINANGLYNFQLAVIPPQFRPYVGLGMGLLKTGEGDSEDKLTGAWNFIIGTNMDVKFGEIYIDFTGRNAFKYNQLIVGYRFPF